MDSAGIPDNSSYFYGSIGQVAAGCPMCTRALLALAGGVALIYLWVCHYWPTSFERMRDKTCELPLPPGTMGFPFVGETIEFIKKGSAFFAQRLGRHGPVYKTHLLGAPTVRVVGGDHVKHVLLGEHVTVCSHWPASTRTLMGKHSLMGCHGDAHRATKAALMALFAPSAVAPLAPVIQDVLDRRLDIWCNSGGQLLGFPACQDLALDLAQVITLGLGLDAPESGDFRSAMKTFLGSLFSLPVKLPGFALHKGLKARDHIVGLVQRQWSEFRAGGADTKHLCLLERMAQLPDLVPQPEVVEDNVLELVFASYATMSSTFSSTLLCLARYPEVREKIEAELQREGLLDDVTIPLTYDLMQRLDYVRNFNREVLRLFPSAGAGFRKAIKTLNIGGYQVPKGWTVAYSIRETQEQSSLFADREVLRPERWTGLDAGADDDLKKRGRFEYLPFGVGARACVGQRLAVLQQAIFLVELLRRCRFTLQNAWSPLTHIPCVKPVDNMPITFTKRQ